MCDGKTPYNDITITASKLSILQRVYIERDI